MQEILSTVTEVSIHPDGQSPVFGEQAIKVRIDDEGAGAFFVIESLMEGQYPIKLDVRDMPHIINAMKFLIGQRGVNSEDASIMDSITVSSPSGNEDE